MENSRGGELGKRIIIPRMRELLTANRTYFVRNDGSDNNSGLRNDASGAFRQITKAIEVIEKLDLNGFDITIQVSDGTYDAITLLRPLVGGNCVIQGNSTNPQNCIIQEIGTDGYAVFVNNSFGYTLDGFELRVNFSNNSFNAFLNTTDRRCCLVVNSTIKIENIRYNSTSGGNGYFLFGNGSIIVSNTGTHTFLGNAYCAINVGNSTMNFVDSASIGFPNNTATQMTFNSNAFGFSFGPILNLGSNMDFFQRRWSGSWSGGNFGRIEAGYVRVRHPNLPSNVQTATTQNGGIHIVIVG